MLEIEGGLEPKMEAGLPRKVRGKEGDGRGREESCKR